MRIILCIVLLVPAACSSPSREKPTLRGEIKKLRTALAALLSAQAFGGKEAVPAISPSFTGGVGGNREGIDDFYWVLGKGEFEGRTVPILCLYQIDRRGRIELKSTRSLEVDLQIPQMNTRPSQRDLRRALERAKK